MKKQDLVYTDKDGYRLHVVSLSPDKPKRLLLIPPLVGANGFLAIKTFRYFFREDCLLMSFDYCGHSKEVDDLFTFDGTFSDTKAALAYVSEYSRKHCLPAHVIGTCYGLIPLIHGLNALEWPREIKSMFSVNGLLSINDILNFDDYKVFLNKKGRSFRDKADFIDFISANKKKFVDDKQRYIQALTEYLLHVFSELSDIISSESFGELDYSRVDFYKTFFEFVVNDFPEIRIPDHFPCLFFAGTEDTIFSLREKEREAQYFSKTIRMAPHARIFNIRINHFGQGRDHYLIGEEGIKFLQKNESSLC